LYCHGWITKADQTAEAFDQDNVSETELIKIVDRFFDHSGVFLLQKRPYPDSGACQLEIYFGTDCFVLLLLEIDKYNESTVRTLHNYSDKQESLIEIEGNYWSTSISIKERHFIKQMIFEFLITGDLDKTVVY
jgi:hypothetical protein